MKKIILTIFCILLLTSFVSAWSADRIISGKDVTINIDETGGTGVFTVQEIVTGTTINTYPAGLCGLDVTETILTCDSDSPTERIIDYTTVGCATIAGEIVGGLPSSSQTIAGDDIITECGTPPSPIIKINEFESNPIGTDSGNEWIELYNPNAFPVNITGWKIVDIGASETILSGTIGANDYLLIEEPTYGLSLVNPNEILTLKDDSDVQIDQTATLADEDDDDSTWQRIPDGIDNWQFEPSTKNAENQEGVDPTPEDPADDLMVNYVRGHVVIEGLDAIDTTEYRVEVLTGINAGEIFIGQVNDDIPLAYQSQGNFDTLDQIEFSTGETFRVTIPGYSCFSEGIFENGGNGDFGTGLGLIELDCGIPNNVPVLDLIGDKFVNEGDLLEFDVTATDLDLDPLIFTIDILPTGASFIDNGNNGTFSWTPGSTQDGTYDIEFSVSDGPSSDSETITITVNDINHNPELTLITDKQLSENESDSFLLGATDLDLDILTFSIIDENLGKVNCEIFANNLTMIPVEYWNGDTTCEVQVSDGKGGTDSQIFNIEVTSVNNPPILVDNLNNITWNENFDLINYLNLNDYFLDPDGDDLTFSVLGNHFIEIIINPTSGVVSFYPDENWDGSENVVFSASDDSNSVNGNAIALKVMPNQPPVITGYSPGDNPVFMENIDKEFSISVSDPEDDELEITWYLDDVEDGTGEDYMFNQVKGTYEVKVIVSDGEYEVENIWNVVVKAVSDLTCVEVEGFIMDANEECLGDIWDTFDSDELTCCSRQGEPKFGDVRRCESLNEKIIIDIRDPDDNEEFMIGEKIDVKIDVENDFNEDFDFDVEVYFYDLTDDDKIEDKDDNVDVDSKEDETLEFEFEIDEDFDEGNSYAIFVKVEEEDGLYCNEEYVFIDIEREEHDVVIEDILMDELVNCGGSLIIETKIKNRGSEEEDVYLSIKNSELNISEITEEFELEEYDEDDEVTKYFSIKIPEKAEEGNYKIDFTSFFDDGDEEYLIKKDLFVECKDLEMETQKIGSIFLEGDHVAKSKIKDNGNIILIFGILVLIILIIIFLLWKIIFFII
jgi:hypothetical protein